MSKTKSPPVKESVHARDLRNLRRSAIIRIPTQVTTTKEQKTLLNDGEINNAKFTFNWKGEWDDPFCYPCLPRDDELP